MNLTKLLVCICIILGGALIEPQQWTPLKPYCYRTLPRFNGGREGGGRVGGTAERRGERGEIGREREGPGKDQARMRFEGGSTRGPEP